MHMEDSRFDDAHFRSLRHLEIMTGIWPTFLAAVLFALSAMVADFFWDGVINAVSVMLASAGFGCYSGGTMTVIGFTDRRPSLIATVAVVASSVVASAFGLSIMVGIGSAFLSAAACIYWGYRPSIITSDRITSTRRVTAALLAIATFVTCAAISIAVSTLQGWHIVTLVAVWLCYDRNVRVPRAIRQTGVES